MLSTTRVRELMAENHCSYSTAYAQMRRELKAQGALSDDPSLTPDEQYILRRADEIRGRLARDAALKAQAALTDPVAAARERLRLAKLAKYNTRQEYTEAVEAAAREYEEAKSKGASS